MTADSFWGKDLYKAFRDYVEARYHRVSEAQAYLVFDVRGVKAHEVNDNQELRHAPHFQSPAPRWQHDEELTQPHDRL